MGVEPTLDQEAGRATVLKTAGELIQDAFACSSLCLRTAFPVDTCAHCSCVPRDCTRFGVKSGVKNDSGLHSVGPRLGQKARPRTAAAGTGPVTRINEPQSSVAAGWLYDDCSARACVGDATRPSCSRETMTSQVIWARVAPVPDTSERNACGSNPASTQRGLSLEQAMWHGPAVTAAT